MEMTARQSGLLVPSKPEPQAKTPQGLTVAEWERFRHCNSETIHDAGARRQGGIQFGWHVGKPLRQELWEDLVHVVGIRGLWILANEPEWTIEPIPGPYAVVYVDSHETDIVRDIRIGGFR